MVYTVTLFAWRKPDITPAQFREHYENRHMPLIQKLAGDTFPISHTRHYIARSADPQHAALALIGGPEAFTYDAFALISFVDEAAFQRFWARLSEGENARLRVEDEEKFLDVSRITGALIGEVTSTRADS